MGKLSNEDEYREKWAYVRHSETLQDKQLQWYFATSAIILVFIYGPDYSGISTSLGSPSIPLIVLEVYSLLFSLRMLKIKSNYQKYTGRIRKLEGQSDKDNSSRKILSIFKLQYYGVALVGAMITKTLAKELNVNDSCSWAFAAIYLIIIIGLSFTKLIEEN